MERLIVQVLRRDDLMLAQAMGAGARVRGAAPTERLAAAAPTGAKKPVSAERTGSAPEMPAV
jgi:hypothetical protein